mmetsp:Transcript_13135/g.39740  ORF Transcript_13135/g.39740 Transcript_13135/m.39740 type:complete len:221 (+) Transcript_13135:3908-4570(+)
MVRIPSGVSYVSWKLLPSLRMPVSFHCTLMFSACLAAMARGRLCRPFLNEPTVWPAGRGGSRGSRGGGGLAFLAWICLITPAMMLPPAFSSAYTLPKAAFMDRLAALPAYTPEQNGSIRRSNTSVPRFLLTYSSTLSSCSGSGFLMPTAPRPARILPHRDSSLKVTMSGPLGVGSSSPPHSTNRGAVGSPSTSSSSIPASTAALSMASLGWKELGPSSQR